MPRLAVEAFLDPSNTGGSIAQSSSRVINWYLETADPGKSRSPAYPKRRPGMEPFAYLGSSSVRGVFEINDRMFAVAGTTFAEVLVDGTLTNTGTVANDNQPVCWGSNGSAGNQVILVGADTGYIFDLLANTLSPISDPDFPNPARSCDFMDGYFLVSQGGGSRSVQWSALEDGTSWDPLDVLERSEAADNISSIIRNHREIWVYGFRTSEVWYDSGDPSAIFAPYQGVFVEMGAQGIFTPQRCDNSLLWMGLNENGQGMIFRADGYVPKRVSTYAVETDLQRATTPTDARAFSFQMNGHIFYVLQLPRDLDTTWVYDVTTNRWFEWGHWDSTNSVYLPWVADNHVFCFNTHYMGSRVDGTIYTVSPDFIEDHLTGV